MPSAATNRMHKNLWILPWGRRAHHLHTQRHQHEEQWANSENLQFLSKLLCAIGCTSMSELLVASQEIFLDLFLVPHACRKLSNDRTIVCLQPFWLRLQAPTYHALLQPFITTVCATQQPKPAWQRSQGSIQRCGESSRQTAIFCLFEPPRLRRRVPSTMLLSLALGGTVPATPHPTPI